MKITVKRPSDASDAATVHVSGEMDIVGSPDVLEAIHLVYAGGCDHVAVDLRDVTFLDSTGISALIAGRKEADRRGGRLQIVNVPDTPRRTLEITGVLDLLTGRSQDTGPSWWVDSGDPDATEPSSSAPQEV